MLDPSASVKLAKGLTNFTRKGVIRWEENSPSELGSSLTVWRVMGRPKKYRASAGGASYEISSSDGLGGSPYELRVWELQGARMVAVAEITSSISLADPNQFELNDALKELFTLVDEMTETSEQIVDRLLGNLGNPD